MKKYMIIFVALLTLVSCTKLVELNTDPKNPEDVPAGALFANATVDLFERMASPNVNYNNLRLWAQQWAQVTYTDESNYNLTERDVNGRMYTLFYAGILRDLKEAKPLIEEDEFLSQAEKDAQLAMISVLEVMAYHIMVDIFGDIPFTEALGDDVTPAYDDDKDIYYAIIDQLNAAIPNLKGNSGMGSYDLVYGGNADLWRKAANTLKLRLAMRIADENSTKSRDMAEAAYNDGVITALAENFALVFSSSTPHTNPLWEDLIQSGRTDFVAASTLVDLMNDLDDPRRDDYFMGPVDSVGNPIGGIPGAGNSYAVYSHAGARLIDPTEPGILLSYPEAEFYLADAAARGYNVGGTAESHYNEAITASILYWDGTQAEATAYLAQPDVAWSTAPGDFREKIGRQYYIAMYNRGFEAWTGWKLYDAPDMQLAFEAGTVPPFRYLYPVDEYSLNMENVSAAAAKFTSTDYPSNSPYAPVFWNVN